MNTNSVKITVHKTQFDFHFGIGFLGELLESTGLEMDELMSNVSKNPFKMIPIIMHKSAKYGAERKEKDFTYTIYDFIDLIDAEGGIASVGVNKFLESFTSSMTKDVPKEETVKAKEGQSKKKLTGK